jgi:hypothetical protein
MLALFAAVIAATINTGSQPCGSAAFGKYLYVDNYGAGTMSKIDPPRTESSSASRSGAGRAASLQAAARSGSRTTTARRSPASTQSASA